MPSREFSMKNFWMALVSSAVARGDKPLPVFAGLLPASLGRPTCPIPWPSLNATLAFAKSKLPSASTSLVGFSCQTHIICAAFSSSVMRASKSFTRFSAERFVSR
jgi:hypothetical protein